ncbi:disulfide bond formation protein C [Pseudorhodoferax aquiterrae]|uniref:Disulfide bond formation protein C n=1 Tax=Pseudorhodoferax aquiterrae TaxID=747304 RepID=A0ABQ3G6S4_9BURK|nr:disulfide bond formation protein B [Pseudorhodoferax aquiterrae]GHC92871.1 disulfide bond formation protein C [Pseudorhodoferax aquiterrae]
MKIASVGSTTIAASLTRSAWIAIALSWTVALVATLGALFFSEVMQLQPCVLCWYQRIAMFPLVLILGIGAFAQDRSCIRYALPLAAAGWLLAGYHWLVYRGFVPEALQPCGQGPSCTEVKLELAGFVTIPLLSLAAFSLILLFLVAAQRPSRP